MVRSVTERQDDLTLVRAACAGDPGSGAALVRRVADAVWPICRHLTRTEHEAKEALATVLDQVAAGSFERLHVYDGRARLASFLVLICREILCERLLRRLNEDFAAGWSGFEAMFQTDIQRLIKRRLPGADREHLRQDAYQEISLALIADDARRLRAYRRAGAFGGFVLHIADRLLIDYIRTFSKRRRARPVSPDSFCGETPPTTPRLISLEQRPGAADQVSDCSAGANPPEEALIEAESERLAADAGRVLRDLARSLPAEDALYLQIVLSAAVPRPAREIARLMGRPVQEVYRVRQQVKRKLQEAVRAHPAVRKWRTAEIGE
jgi:DNA-directed RNA polymerase specialized sigma24 family protein